MSGNTSPSGNTIANPSTITNPPATTPTDTNGSGIFNLSNLLTAIFFLVIYIVIYYGLAIFYDNKIERSAAASKIFDIFVFVFLIFWLIWTFMNTDYNEILDQLKGTGNTFLQTVDNWVSTLFVILFTIFFYFAVYLSGIPMSEHKSTSISIFEMILWLVIVVGIFANFFRYVLGIPIVDAIQSYFQTNSATADSKVSDDHDATPTPPPPPEERNEVFNIKNNLYTYDDAQAVCKSFGAQLATYDQIEEAYKNGAEWCNYGWSENQMAFFPTQKATWDKLQSNPKKKNNCGRPGVNGGYMANPYIRFGVNCYGKKPKPTEADLQAMRNVNTGVAPQTAQDQLLEEKIKFFKEHPELYMKVNSFNATRW